MACSSSRGRRIEIDADGEWVTHGEGSSGLRRGSSMEMCVTRDVGKTPPPWDSR